MRARRAWAMIATLLAISVAAKSATARPAERAAFAVVIGNNKSLGARRPDLHYADDDAAKYTAILEMIAPSTTWLLTDFDRDSAALYPEAAARARRPTRAALAAAGREIARGVRAAKDSGRETEVYFVFAGHGDVDRGTGFIELADGRFTSEDLESWLRAIPFSHAHVILDSCNSFFMLGVRRPG